MKCQFCEKTFINQGNLNYHQKTAKYCLELREDNLPSGYKCKYCNEKFLRSSILTKHYEVCKVKIKNENTELIENIKKEYESQISKLEKKIEDLENKNQELALRAIDKPSNTTSINTHKSDTITNTYNHLQPVNLTYDHLYKVLDQNLKIEHIYQGQVGLANIVADKLLTNENGKFLAFCNDKSRQIIKYKNSNNELIKDVKAYNLVSSIAPVAEEIANKRKKEFEKEYLNNRREEVTEISSDEEDIKEQVPHLVDENGDFFGFEDEFEETIQKLRNEKNRDKKKEAVEKVIKTISEKENWDEEKKTFYLTKLVKGITDVQMLNLNPSIFSKQLSMILPSDVKNVE